MQSILVYSPKTGPRLNYVLNLVFRDVYGIDYELTQNVELFENSDMPKLNYSTTKFKNDGLRIAPVSLLMEYGVKDHLIEVNNHPQFQKIFFKSGADLPFDIFSAVFWLLVRYEEYLPFKPDKFNRFDVNNSLAFQYDFLHLPIVNLWLEEFRKVIKTKFSDLKFKKRIFNYVSTVDIDNAYKYKHKGLMRTIGGYLKSASSGNVSEIKERSLVIFNKKEDPFDSYSFLLEMQKKYDLKMLFFFLLGDYGVNDKNHPANNKDFQALIKHIADYASTGVHPSFRSNSSLSQLKTEINRLANITHRTVEKSRQHFSVLKFPDTYQSLLQTGVTHEYSMGYHNFNGFRAGFCYPFNWYDLDSEMETALVIHPFCIIETTLRYNSKASVENAVGFAKPIIDEVKKYGGELVSVFHNDTLGNQSNWEGWRNVYEEFVIEVAGRNY